MWSRKRCKVDRRGTTTFIRDEELSFLEEIVESGVKLSDDALSHISLLYGDGIEDYIFADFEDVSSKDEKCEKSDLHFALEEQLAMGLYPDDVEYKMSLISRILGKRK